MELLLESKALSLPADARRKATRLALADRLDEWHHSRWPKALRSCGKKLAKETMGQVRPGRLYCNLNICPFCLARRQNRLLRTIRPRVKSLLGEHGAAAHVVLTGPHDRALEARSRTMLTVMRGFSRKQVWKKPGGLSRRVGVIWAFELDLGTDRKGHPHIHVMVAAAKPDAVQRFVDAILDHWGKGVHGHQPENGAIAILSPDPDSWGPRLNYLLKGSEIDPDWPSDVFDAAVLEFTSGRHHIAAIGLLSSRQGSQNPKPANPSLPSLRRT